MRLLLLLAFCACAGAAPRPDPLAALNRAARDAYAEARGRALAGVGPVLIIGPAHIALLNAGARTEAGCRGRRCADGQPCAHPLISPCSGV